MTEWKGFKFPMGFFVIVDPEGNIRYGKCDPITKEVLKIYDYCNCSDCEVKQWPPKIF